MPFASPSSVGEGEEEVFLNDGAGFAAPFPLKGPSLPLGVEGGPPRMDDCRGGGPGWGFEGYLGFPKIEFQR